MLAGDTCSGLLLVTELKLEQDLGVENSDNGRVLGFFFLANGFCGERRIEFRSERQTFSLST